MTRIPKRLTKLMAATAMLSTVMITDGFALTVFDPLNYEQNLLTAVRALENIQNQVRQLQNQAGQLMRMDRNLQSQTGTVAPDLQSTLAQLRARIAEGDAIALKVQDTEAAYDQLFPKTFAETLTNDDLLRASKTRWDETYATFRRAAVLQGAVNQQTETDARLLDQISARSSDAAGSLQAAQAGNELAALQVKQSLQLQTLLAAQSRSETTALARDLTAEAEGRQRLKTFLGDGRAYTRGQ